MRRALRLGFGRTHMAREVDDELEFHLEMRARTLMANGLSPDDARAEALRQFGAIEPVRDYCLTVDHERERAMQRANTLDALRQDLMYAARVLRRDIGFTAVVVLTLAMGIGANTAIFTLVDAVLLRELPVRAPDQLIAIGDPARISSRSDLTNPYTGLISYPVYTELRQQTQIVSGLLASGRTGRLDVRVDSAADAMEHPSGRFVSGNYFSVLGVPAYRGRTFDSSADSTIGGAPVATISYAYWTSRFAQDPSVVGRTVVVNGVRLTILGVTPQWFTGEIVGRSTDIWLPVTMQSAIQPHDQLLENRQSHWLLLLGRRAPGVGMAEATAAFTTVLRRSMAEHYPDAGSEVDEVTVYVSPGARGFSRVRSTYQVPLFTLMVGVGLLLLIICANVANLLMARAVARGREMGVRLAIGAARGRLVRQLLTESVLLALLSAAAGLVLAWWGSQLLLSLAADGGSSLPLDLRMDMPVLAFTAAVSILAVMLFGLAPALRASRVDLASTIRASASAVTGGQVGHRGHRVPMGRIMIAGQVALSLVLLMGAALLVRSVRAVQGVDTGMDRDHLLIVDIDAQGDGYTGARLVGLTRDLTSRVAVIPGVADVSFSENGIFSGTESATTFQVPGFTARSDEDTLAYFDEAGPGYIAAIGARLLDGRDISERDNATSENVALVNETMASFYFPGTSAIGKTFVINDSISIRIIGVLADTKDHSLSGEPLRRFYLAYAQHPLGSAGSLRLLIRAEGDPALLGTAVRQAIRQTDASLVIDALDPLSTLMRQSISEERLVARLATGFGVLALLLAGIGLYGVLTYAMSRRTGEIGLRVALGAQRGDVIRMVLGDALRLIATGAAIGIPLALLSTRYLENQLHGVGTTDPVSMAVAVTVLVAAGVIASLIPALRASRVAPLLAMRNSG